jgi:small subunit ribosomal protein S17
MIEEPEQTNDATEEAPEASAEPEAPRGPRQEPPAPRSPQERNAERLEARRVKAQRRRAQRQRQSEKRRDGGAARGPARTPPVADEGRGRPRVRQGVVVSDKGDKTITVRIDVARQHRTYKKIVRSSSTLHAHDERNEAHAGDTVRVVESRPLSRTKRWRLVDVLERAR